VHHEKLLVFFARSSDGGLIEYGPTAEKICINALRDIKPRPAECDR